MDGEIRYSCYLFPVWLQSSWRTQVSQVFYVPPIEGNGTKYQVLWQPLSLFFQCTREIRMSSMYMKLQPSSSGWMLHRINCWNTARAFAKPKSITQNTGPAV